MGVLEIVISVYSTIITIILVFVPITIKKYNKTLEEVSSKITDNETQRSLDNNNMQERMQENETQRRLDYNSIQERIQENEAQRRDDFNNLTQRVDNLYNHIITIKSYGKNNIKSLLGILHKFNKLISILKSRRRREDLEEDFSIVADEVSDLIEEIKNEKEYHNEE